MGEPSATVTDTHSQPPGARTTAGGLSASTRAAAPVRLWRVRVHRCMCVRRATGAREDSTSYVRHAAQPNATLLHTAFIGPCR